MHDRARIQVREALGSDNRWYCSKHHGREITDPETLMIYFVRSGGAEDFDARYKMAMSCDNRWYCSEYYGYDVRDPEILWEYFNRCACTDGASTKLALAR